ncbi:hypothetical protein EVA_08675 [gut metagenome]|uniref:Uncharacterized protein n=1 Tax=gut metagenome TaxID=749906 RepID=J9GLY5_9ZZZZ
MERAQLPATRSLMSWVLWPESAPKKVRLACSQVKASPYMQVL